MTLEQAKEILRPYVRVNHDNTTKYDLVWPPGSGMHYVDYTHRKFSKVTLDGDFTIEQLEAILVIMRQEHDKPKRS